MQLLFTARGVCGCNLFFVVVLHIGQVVPLEKLYIYKILAVDHEQKDDLSYVEVKG
jgi:hypothetical protein